MLTLLKPHILAFTMYARLFGKVILPLNLWKQQEESNITISIVSGAGASRQHK